MAISPSSSIHVCERNCREIWRRLNQLGRPLACRTRIRRLENREMYKAIYAEDPFDHLQSQTHGADDEACTLMSMWMLEPHEQDVIIARDALAGVDPRYRALIEIYVGRKSGQLLLVKHAYQAKFLRHLEQDISSEPPTPSQKILVALVTSHKSHHIDVSQDVAKCDAKRLYEAGEGRIGALDESIVLEILSKRSIPQLKLTVSTYKHIYGHNYKEALKGKDYGDFGDSLRLVVKCLCTPVKYYSKLLYESMKGVTVEKSTLARVVIGRAEIDMDEIHASFEKKYGLKVQKAIEESIPNGDYRNILISLATATSTI